MLHSLVHICLSINLYMVTLRWLKCLNDCAKVIHIRNHANMVAELAPKPDVSHDVKLRISVGDVSVTVDIGKLISQEHIQQRIIMNPFRSSRSISSR